MLEVGRYQYTGNDDYTVCSAAGKCCRIGFAACSLGRPPPSTTTWLGLTLSHYDARGHLVVARRIVDSMTPGWQQIGAVWLPLPHLLNALPVQVDAWYRSGASAVAISIACFRGSRPLSRSLRIVMRSPD